MTIKYKFNKNSEARDCVVESVELNIKEQITYDVVPLSKEELIEVLLRNDCGSSEESKLEFIEESKPSNNSWEYGYDITGIVNCAITYLKINTEFYTTKDTEYDLGKGTESGEACVLLNNEDEDISIYGKSTYSYYNGTDLKDIKAERTINKKTIEAHTVAFASSQELKDYINTIQEPIEFITESSIDDVLMKEWIGEWKYKIEKIYIDTHNLINCPDQFEILDIYYQQLIKIGLPNSNWIFKIE